MSASTPVSGHFAEHRGLRSAARLIPLPLWDLLPAQVQGFPCSCGSCRGVPS
jgi:hypothetical protein